MLGVIVVVMLLGMCVFVCGIEISSGNVFCFSVNIVGCLVMLFYCKSWLVYVCGVCWLLCVSVVVVLVWCGSWYMWWFCCDGGGCL